ncbi:MAG: hypothetical protein OXC81_05625, partial [Betaproteobacteria bacterium]|nr:hypothetical protein [Betaproteobacteria bacterium]
QLARITIALTPVPYLGEVSHDDRDMVIWDTFDGRQVQREYNQGEPIDGMAFVVISTGNNRHGGIPSTNRRSSPSGDGYIRCLNSVVNTDTELLNMPRHACNRPAPPSNSGRESYRFFQLPVVRGGFDDELAYMSG